MEKVRIAHRWIIYSIISPNVRTKIGVFYATNENSALIAAHSRFSEWKYRIEVEKDDSYPPSDS